MHAKLIAGAFDLVPSYPPPPEGYLPLVDDYSGVAAGQDPDICVFDEYPDRILRRWSGRDLTLDELWSALRKQRNVLLAASDSASLVLWADRWLAQSPEWRAAWTAYRNALRDLPDTYAAAGPQAVVWPDPPI